jgi:hypothetical protein
MLAMKATVVFTEKGLEVCIPSLTGAEAILAQHLDFKAVICGTDHDMREQSTTFSLRVPFKQNS